MLVFIQPCRQFIGETALFIACSNPKVSIDVVTTLIEANPDLVNYVNNEEVNLLQCAIRADRLDIVKVLTSNGCPVNEKDLDGDTALHIAAIHFKLDIIRYFLHETDCDTRIRNNLGKVACIPLFAKLLTRADLGWPLLPEEIDCFEEMARFTFDVVNVNSQRPMDRGPLADLNEMVLLCYYLDQPKCKLYTTILKLFHVPPTKQYFVDKILASNACSYHCLIIGLLHIVDCVVRFDEIRCMSVEMNNEMHRIWSKFLLELYTLFLSDESFFHEYISEFMSAGWNFADQCQEIHQLEPLCAYITKTKESFDPQKFFTFMKTLVLHGINLKMLMRQSQITLVPMEMLVVFASLVDVVTIRIDDQNFTGVISLKDLCRMSVRRYYFLNYSHYDALKALYSLDVPVPVRDFICYNPGNLIF